MSNVFNVANLPEQLIWTGVGVRTLAAQSPEAKRLSDLHKNDPPE
jgi:hypothetical protein